MQRFLLLLICLMVSQTATPQRFSDSVRISLITGDPGEDLYAHFGHSAVRVQDLKYDKDLVYNYGTFDFDTPNFYLKFIRGKLDYTLSIGRTDRMIEVYEYYGRELREQELLLDSIGQQKIVAFLQKNYEPENRAYRYDFFYDNCATRIRDLLESELNTQVDYMAVEPPTQSFRDLLDLYIQGSPWMDFGIDLILGLPADKIASVREQMFLPDFLADNLERSLRYRTGRKILAAPVVMKELGNREATKNFPISPMVLFVSLFVLITVASIWGTKRLSILIDRIWFPLLSIAGLFLLFMWLGTDHIATHRNLNILWLNPLFLFLLFRPMPRLALGLLLLQLLLLITWPVFPQAFHWAFIPIISTSCLRLLDQAGFLQQFRKRV